MRARSVGCTICVIIEELSTLPGASFYCTKLALECPNSRTINEQFQLYCTELPWDASACSRDQCYFSSVFKMFVPGRWIDGRASLRLVSGGSYGQMINDGSVMSMTFMVDSGELNVRSRENCLPYESHVSADENAGGIVTPTSDLTISIAHCVSGYLPDKSSVQMLLLNCTPPDCPSLLRVQSTSSNPLCLITHSLTHSLTH